MRLTALRADVATLSAEAIVNPANSALAGGGGVDGRLAAERRAQRTEGSLAFPRSGGVAGLRRPFAAGSHTLTVSSPLSCAIFFLAVDRTLIQRPVGSCDRAGSIPVLKACFS
jgi:hypothetical protein